MKVPAKPRRIGFFGHFGSLNSGNEITLMTVLAQLRDRFPEAEFFCVCTNPEVVSARDGISAVRIDTNRATNWSSPRVVRQTRKAAGEAKQLLRAFRELRRTDLLIVPGTGLVTDAFGVDGWGPLGLFRWILAAKLRRAKVAFVSIGAGPFYTTRGKVFARASLTLADYRSYRDQLSRENVRRIGVSTELDPLYPDLVLGLPSEFLPAAPHREPGRRVVALGLMADAGRYSSAEPIPGAHAFYLEQLCTFAAWVLEHGYDLRLLFGDGDGDIEVLGQFESLLGERCGPELAARVAKQPSSRYPPSSADVLDELSLADVVVATRFHNVVLSLVMGKPVIAISFHHKCTSVMEQMKLSDYCHDIHGIDAGRLIEQFEMLELNEVLVKQTIMTGINDARSSLGKQYRLLFPEF